MDRSYSGFLLFRVGTNPYAISTASVRQVLFFAELSVPPTLPSVLAGFLNLEGELVPVLSVARLLNTKIHEAGLYTPLIVVACGRRPVALLIDAVHEVVCVEASAVPAVPLGVIFNECVTGSVLWKDESVPILSAERLLTEQERLCVEKLRDLEQRRLSELSAGLA